MQLSCGELSVILRKFDALAFSKTLEFLDNYLPVWDGNLVAVAASHLPNLQGLTVEFLMLGGYNRT
jgi:hypothetical protein